MTDLLYALAMLGALAMALGGLWMWRRDRKRALLLLAAATVTLVNVLSWSTLPSPQGVAPPAAG
jgi:hypothetical protein